MILAYGALAAVGTFILFGCVLLVGAYFVTRWLLPSPPNRDEDET